MHLEWTKNYLLVIILIVVLVELDSCDAMVMRKQPDITKKRQMANINAVNIPNLYSLLEDGIHIEDFFSSLNISQECMNASRKLVNMKIDSMHPLDSFKEILKSPLAKMLDAWAKPPSRMLLMNSQWKGAADECSTIDSAKYCLTNNITVLGQAGVSYGSCFPTECLESDVTEVLSMLSGKSQGLMSIDRSTSSTYCDEPKPYTTGFYITLFILLSLLGLCIIGTLVDVCMGSEKPKIANNNTDSVVEAQVNGVYNKSLEFDENTTSLNKKSVHANEGENGNNKSVPDNDDTSADKKNEFKKFSLPLKIKEIVHSNKCIDLLKCFSFHRNIEAIISTRVPEGSITSIHGIRVISLAWVILGHFYVFVEFSSQPDNLLNMIDIIHRFTFLPIGNAYVSVDTFFLLSGLLVGYLTLRRIDKQGMGFKDIPLYYLHRYIRLTPSLILVILFYTNIFPFIVKQPMGFSLSQINVQPGKCVRYWWQPLLYINNFSPSHFEDGCIPWTWYLANDMQFYIISPFILFMMVWIEKKFYKNSGSVIYNTAFIFFICAVSMLVTAVITQTYNIPTLLTSALFLLNNPRAGQSNMVMDKLYDKPYIRVAPYLIGLWLGYLVSRKICLPEKGKKIVSLFGWIASISIGILVVYGTWNVFKKNGTFLNATENIVYSSVHRFAWSCAVGWVIYACHNKIGGIVNTFLSWRVWIPLSRLTYGSYLIHIIVLVFFMFSRETPTHYQDTTAVFDYISNLVVTFCGSFVLALCVEQPVMNLGKIVLQR